MRITFLTPADNLTGGTRVVAIYAKSLQARGHQVQVISNAPAPTTLRQRWRALKHGHWQAQQREIRASREPGHIGLSGVPHRILARHRPMQATDLPDADILIATWWETAVWMHAMPAEKGRKVHLIQGYEIWWGGAEARAQVHAALRLPNLKVAISAGLKRDIESELGELDIHVVPNAVDPTQFNAPARSRRTPPTVGFIYSTDPIKGADRCVRAIALARAQLPDLRVLAFGTQPAAAALPLPADTDYHPRPPQATLADLYARCDAWLFTSRVDSFGLPILEAMACRTPVIGVPVGAAADLLSDGAGLLVEPPTQPQDEAALPQALATALVNLLSGPASHWQAMSDRAHARAHAYSWQDATARLEALLIKNLATQPPSQPPKQEK